MRLLLLLFVSVISSFGRSQHVPYPSEWPIEHNVQHHVAHAFINRIVDRGRTQIWDSTAQRYISPTYEYVTFPEGANQRYDFQLVETKFPLSGYMKEDFSDFTPDRFEMSIKKGKVTRKGYIHYDSIGRMIELKLKKRYSLNVSEKESFAFNYSDPQKIAIRIKQSSFAYFGNYQSKIAGSIRYRPVRKRSDWHLEQFLNENSCTDSVISTHRSHVNIRKNYLPELSQWRYYFKWDAHGRMTYEQVMAGSDSVNRENSWSYSDRRVTSNELSNLTLLKSPPIKRWIDSIPELYLTKTQSSEGPSQILRTRDFQLLAVIEKPRSYSDVIVDHVYDSVSHYRSFYRVTQIDSLDTIPYDPNRKPVVLYTRNFEQSEHYARPKGLLDVSAEVYRRSEMKLENGWTVIRYQRGSSGYTRAALGYKPFVRLDSVNDRFLFLNPQGEITYMYEHKKLYKIEKH